MATFSDFYEQRMASNSRKPSSSGLPKYDFSGIPTPGRTANNPNPQSPVDWIIDIISRPAFGGVAAARGVLEGSAQAMEGNPLAAIGGVAAAPTNFLAGLFGANNDDADYRRLTSGMLEDYTDRFGKIVDKDYVDRKDNVDPIAKGVLGFVGDVLLDPTTYIGAGLISAGAKGVLKGGKAVVEGAKGLTKGGKAAETAAEGVVDASRAVPTPPVAQAAEEGNVFSGVTHTAEDVAPRTRPSAAPPVEMNITPGSVETWARNSASPSVQKAIREYDSMLSKIDSSGAAFNSSKAAADLTKKEAELARMFSQSNKLDVPSPLNIAPRFTDEADRTWTAGFQRAVGANGAAIKQTIDDTLKMVGDAGAASTKPAMGVDEWLNKNLNNMVPDEAFDAAISTARIPSGLVDDLSNRLLDMGGVGSPFTYRRLDDIARNAPGDLGKAARILVKELHKTSGAQSSSTAVTDALAAFNVRRAQDEDLMRNSLGRELFEFLERRADSSTTTVKSFEKTLRDVSRLADPATDIARVINTTPATRDAVANTLGLPKYASSEVNAAEEVAQARAAIEAADIPATEAVLKALSTETPAGKEIFLQKYPHREGNVAFTEADRTVRLGRHVRQLNTFFQYTLNKNMTQAIYRRMEATTGRGIKEIPQGLVRTGAFREAFYTNWAAAARALDTLGIQSHIGVGKQDFVNLNLGDVFRITEAGFKTPEAALAALFNGKSAVAPTRLAEAVHWITTTGAKGQEALDGVTKILRNEKLQGYRGQKLDINMPNNSLSSGAPVAHFPANAQKAAQAMAAKIPGAVVTKNGTKGWHVRTGEGGVVSSIAEAVVRSADGYAARAAENSAAYAARGMKEVKSLTTTQLNRINKVLAEGDLAAGVEMLARMRAKTAEAASEIGAFPSSKQAADELLESAIGSFALTRARAMQKAANLSVQGSKARTKSVSESSMKVSDATTQELDELLDQKIVTPDETASAATAVKTAEAAEAGVDEIPALDLASMRPFAEVQGQVNTFLHGFRTALDTDYGMKNVFGLFHAKRTVAGQYLDAVVRNLRPLSKYSPEIQNAALKSIQTGVRNVNPEVAAASAQIQKVVDMMFDTSGKNGLLNSRHLNAEADIKHINEILKMKGLDENRFFFKDTDDLDDLTKQWRSWEFTNPSEELYRFADAAATVAEQRSIVNNFVSTMKKEKLISEKYQPGFVKIADSGGSTFAKLLPEGIFVDKAMAGELHRLDVLTRTSREFSGEAGEFLRKTYIPIQNIWKQLVTVFRVGHHVRNAAGNSFMSWIDRGNRHYTQSQMAAFKVLGVKNSYSDADIVASLASVGERAVPTGKDVIVRGRFGNMDSDEIYKLAQDHGLFSSYQVTEDLMGEMGLGKIGKLGTKISTSRVGEAAGTVSHLVDHHGKLQHFIQIMMQESGKKGRWKLGKQKTIERAIKEVKRAHPDSIMLTPGEAKWRFLIPFYTWFAKTLPFAMESAARNPGRLAALPKASYNLAVAMGVDPASITDPFPEDQLFPSFLTEGAFGPQFVGPDGQYININPGVPQFDMLESITDPLSMVSPLLKVPAEAATGSQIGGRKINDVSDYIDQNTPIINYIANMTGTSVSGSLASMLQGKGLDPQAQVARGNKNEFDQLLSALGWVTGVQPSNWSRPNYINYAEIEKRDRAREG